VNEEKEVERMSTRCSELYVSVAKEEGKETEYHHSFHIYREAFSGEYFVVDDFNRCPVKLTKRTALEIVRKYKECQVGK
jgi:uncharacterized protein YrzB (UPF0473 family)